MRNNNSVKQYWEEYIYLMLPDIISGKQWIYFPAHVLKSLQTAGLAHYENDEWYINYEDTTFVVDHGGNCIEVIHKGSSYEPQPNAEIEWSRGL